MYLFSADAGGNLSGYAHGFKYGAQFIGVTFGRYVTSVGAEHLIAQSANTLSNANSGPLIGPVVLSEIMYHPPEVFAHGAYWNNTEDEYIELFNRNDERVDLFDVNYPTNNWRLNGAIEFALPRDTTIPAGGYLLVVSFDPFKDTAQSDAFRAKYSVPADVQIVGPYKGNLSNDDGAVALERPDGPVLTGADAGTVPYVLVEQVRYKDALGWPVAADGGGFALHRKEAWRYADDPINWVDSSPTPGRAWTTGPPPALTSQPRSQSVVAGSPVTFRVAAGGQGPYRFQWRLNDQDIPGATSSVLTINNVTNIHEGSYTVVCRDEVGSVVSRAALLTVLIKPMMLVPIPPLNVTTVPGETITLGAQLHGTLPMFVRWRLFRTAGGVIVSDQTVTHPSTFINYTVAANSSGVLCLIVTNIVGGSLTSSPEPTPT